MEAFAMPEPEPKIDQQELAHYETVAVSVIDEARLVATSIKDRGSYTYAADWIRKQKSELDNVERSGLAMFRDYLHRGHKAACDRISRYTTPLKTGVQMVRGGMADFDAQQERIRAEEQRKLDEAARKRDEEQRIAEAERLAKLGHTEQADKVLETPGSFAAPKIEPEKVAGVSMRTVYEATVVDKREFLKFIGEHPGYEHFVSIDVRELANYAKKTDCNQQLPGIQMTKRKVPNIR